MQLNFSVEKYVINCQADFSGWYGNWKHWKSKSRANILKGEKQSCSGMSRDFQALFLNLPSLKFTAYMNSSVMQWCWFSFHHQRLVLRGCSHPLGFFVWWIYRHHRALNPSSAPDNTAQYLHQSSNISLSFNAANMKRVRWENRAPGNVYCDCITYITSSLSRKPK